ncbi:SGNH/GDSL hydrolase family protein [Nanoarchaeota archaeon]
MRYYWVLLLLVMASCTIVQETGEEAQVIAEEIAEAAEEVVEEIAKEPLSMDFKASDKQAELKLETKLTCIASGGTEPYDYDWQSTDVPLDCSDQECDIIIEEIGDYSVTCSVTDAEGESVQESLTLEVIKLQRQVVAVVTFGDSLTAGHGLQDREKSNWARLLTDDFEDSKLFNYAVGGHTTRNILDLQFPDFKEDNLPEGDKLVFLWIGANDISKFFKLSDFDAFYREIVDELIMIPDAEVILMDIPDASKLKLAEDIESDVNEILGDFGFGVGVALRQIGSEVMEEYNQIIAAIAEDYDLPLLDMFSYMETFDQEIIAEDGFHPNEAGHIMVKDKVNDDIKALYPDTEFY